MNSSPGKLTWDTVGGANCASKGGECIEAHLKLLSSISSCSNCSQAKGNSLEKKQYSLGRFLARRRRHVRDIIVRRCAIGCIVMIAVHSKQFKIGLQFLRVFNNQPIRIVLRSEALLMRLPVSIVLHHQKYTRALAFRFVCSAKIRRSSCRCHLARVSLHNDRTACQEQFGTLAANKVKCKDNITFNEQST